MFYVYECPVSTHQNSGLEELLCFTGFFQSTLMGRGLTQHSEEAEGATFLQIVGRQKWA